MLKHRASIDTGARGAGIAIWDNRTWEELVHPVYTANFYGKQGEEWLDSLQTISGKLSGTIDKYRVIEVYCELPAVWVGNAAAATGDLVKLASAVGAIAEVCRVRHIHLTAIPVIVWKGTLPKEIVEKRVKARLPRFSGKAHVIDAVGIGLHAKGYF